LPEQYPGYVLRQSLIEFCQAEVVTIGESQKALENALETKGLSDSDRAVLNESYSSNIGAQSMLRKITEWAAAHSAPPVGTGAGAGYPQ
jgi:hypothetical protein